MKSEVLSNTITTVGIHKEQIEKGLEERAYSCFWGNDAGGQAFDFRACVDLSSLLGFDDHPEFIEKVQDTTALAQAFYNKVCDYYHSLAARGLFHICSEEYWGEFQYNYRPDEHISCNIAFRLEQADNIAFAFGFKKIDRLEFGHSYFTATLNCLSETSPKDFLILHKEKTKKYCYITHQLFQIGYIVGIPKKELFDYMRAINEQLGRLHLWP